MSRILPENYPLYDTVYGSEVPTEQYYVVLFDILPSKYVNTSNYDPAITEFFTSIGFVEETNIFSSNRRYDLSSQSLYVNRDLKMMIRISGNTNKIKDNLVQLDIVYNILNGSLSSQLDLNKIKEHEKPKKKANIQLVKSEMGHLDTEEYDLFVPPMDLEMNYGTDFLRAHNVIVEKLNETNGKGIILLHGDPGTGKTSYIKLLTSLIKDKDILFIPPSMAEMLSEPSIIPFLMDHKNSILIIEDAERVISDREGNGSPAGVSNILNLTDGILGDCLSIQIVATFNMKREKIDQALLRKGRLIVEHRFGKLSPEESNKLLKHLEKDHIVEESMCLADIYNIDVELIKTSNKSKIGF
jgi:SpoVK/Ycf46/Vps4 family AAA+-type ATPase